MTCGNESEIGVFWKIGRALFEGVADGDKAAVDEAIDDLEVMLLHSEDPFVRSRCSRILAFHAA